MERVVEKAQRRLLLALAAKSDHNLAAPAVPSTPATLIFLKQAEIADGTFGLPSSSICLSVPNLGAGTHRVEPYRFLSSSLVVHFPQDVIDRSASQLTDDIVLGLSCGSIQPAHVGTVDDLAWRAPLETPVVSKVPRAGSLEQARPP